jgi:hypothetical protein
MSMAGSSQDLNRQGKSENLEKNVSDENVLKNQQRNTPIFWMTYHALLKNVD